MGISPSEALSEIDIFSGDDITELDQGYGKILCNHLSFLWNERQEDSKKIAGEKYKFKKYICKSGESILIKAYDEEIQKDIVLKIALPDKLTTKGKIKKGFTLAFMLLPKEERNKKNLSRSAERFLNAGYAQQAVFKTAAKDNFKYCYIPEVFYISPASNFPYIAMEYLESQPLLSWLKENNELTRLLFFMNLVNGVERYLHDRNIVHCDLAPDNILIKIYNGKILPVIIDFGMHKNFTIQSTLTHNRDDIGRPLYRPPEMKDDPTQRDFRTDIFMLGNLLWIIWMKEIPEDAIQLFANSSKQSLFPPEFLPASLRGIFTIATMDNANERYQEIEPMKKDLEAVYSELLPRLKKNILEDENWESKVKNSQYIPVLKKIFAIIKKG